MDIATARGALGALLGATGFLQADRLFSLTLPPEASPLAVEHAEIEEGIGPLPQHVGRDEDGGAWPPAGGGPPPLLPH
ncbi:MAG TPA: hypothetical protein VF457_09440, partial [Burkholderiaceae bacterium]